MTDATNGDASDAEQVADAIMGDMKRLMVFQSDLQPGEEREATIKLIVSNRIRDGEPIIGVEGITFIPSEEHQRMEEIVLDRVDLRKSPTPDQRHGMASVDIGTITFNREGDITDVTVDPEYVKPSARGDGDE